MVQPTGLECSPPHSALSFSKWHWSLLKFDSSPVSETVEKQKPILSNEFFDFSWCNRQDLNLWPPPSQGGVLIQLNYGCIRIGLVDCIYFLENASAGMLFFLISVIWANISCRSGPTKLSASLHLKLTDSLVSNTLASAETRGDNVCDDHWVFILN